MAKKVEPIFLPLLLEFSTSLPASPRIFSRLSKLIQDEDTGLDYVAAVVKMDPSLTAHILRVTNSAYYGGVVKLNDIESAIARIGFNEVHKVLSVVIAHDSFYQALPAYNITATEFADECISVAVASEILAQRIGLDMNAPYIAGLLHGIGKLAINLYLEKLDQIIDLTRVSESDPKTLINTELELLGTTHWHVGSELLKHWQFEAEIWQPIRQQMNPLAPTSHTRQTAILTTAAWLSQHLASYDSDAPLSPEIRWSIRKLHIDATELASLIDEVRLEFYDRQNLFSMLH